MVWLEVLEGLVWYASVVPLSFRLIGTGTGFSIFSLPFFFLFLCYSFHLFFQRGRITDYARFFFSLFILVVENT
jgi:hypothetical protein